MEAVLSCIAALSFIACGFAAGRCWTAWGEDIEFDHGWAAFAVAMLAIAIATSVLGGAV